MPEIDMTQPAMYWPLHTEEEINDAAADIFEKVPSTFTEVHRGYDGNQVRTIMLRVGGPGMIFVEAQQGLTVVKSAAGWEALTDSEAALRGIPVPTPDDTVAP